ncbi:hypothetical protein FRC06_005580 [Ceratobasidium sp. 370]|nr:hypothetical protein FRC06_005580 [Ceratobasidium sp. 370]
MLFSAIRSLATTALFGLSFVSAQNSTQATFNCGTAHDPDAIAAAEALFTKNAGGVSAAASGPIPVVWNVILGTNGQGNIPDIQIGQQIRVLTGNFPGLFNFQLKEVRRITNFDWFNNAGPGTPAERNMKGAYHDGGPETLNIYSTALFESSRLYGYARFPWEYQQDPKMDGVVIDYRVVSGGTAVGYNTGKILVHEVGHWSGLYHTFQGGCSAPGDYVDDTPAEASPASGCPVGRDTCGAPGVDP